MFLALPRAHFVFLHGHTSPLPPRYCVRGCQSPHICSHHFGYHERTKSRYRSALSKFRHIFLPGGAPFSQQELATALSSESLVALFIGTQAEHRYSYETVRVDLMSLRSLAVGLGVPPVPSFSRYVERLLRGYKIGCHHPRNDLPSHPACSSRRRVPFSTRTWTVSSSRRVGN